MGDACLDRGAGLEADILHEFIDIGVGDGDVAGLHGQVDFFGGLACGLLDDFDEVFEGDGLIVADVVELVGGLAGLVGGDVVHDANDAFDNIVDVGEVAFHVAVVVDLDGLTCGDRFDKFEVGHVGSSPGTVDGEKAQSGHGQAVEMAVSVGH